MMVVTATTTSAAVFMLTGHVRGIRAQLALPPDTRNGTMLLNTSVQAALTLAMLACAAVVIIGAVARIWSGMSSPGARRTVPVTTRDLPVEPIA
jgi:hypothetical protein